MDHEVIATVIATEAATGTDPLKWEEVLQRFDDERWYWLATASHDGWPQVRPVLAVCVEDHIYSTTSPDARKGRNLLRVPQCTLTARADGIDIVVEGSASWVDDHEVLRRVGAAYQTKYGWPVTITDQSMFDAPYGAPTAGPPPYRVYRVAPKLVYAFGTSDNLGDRSTRFRFT